ncbi:MAG: ATP-binding protein [Bauldia sp.]
MSFNANQRLRHQAIAEQAFRSGAHREAVFHTAKAAEFSLLMAETSAGEITRAYIRDAAELIDLAERIRRKAPADVAAPARARRPPDEDAGQPGEWELSERPSIRFADVAGLAEVKQALHDNVVIPLRHPQVLERLRLRTEPGLLMYGPPGNGKTFIAKAVAGEVDAAFLSVNAATMKSKWVGRAEKNVKRLFDTAAKYERAIIFIDECHSVLGVHANERTNLADQFLVELDGIATQRRPGSLFVLAATNLPWLVGDAILRPGRIGRQVYVGLPDVEGRAAILRGAFADVGTEGAFPFDELALGLDGCSGADIAWACERAKLPARDRSIAENRPVDVRLVDLQDALARVPRSISRQQVADLLRWGEERSSRG